MKYPLLTWVLRDLLNHVFDRDVSEKREGVYSSIAEKRTDLLNEIAAANADPTFSWLELSYDTRWLNSSYRNQYHLVLVTEEEVFEHFKLWVWYGLYPETRYEDEHLWRMTITVYYILRDKVLSGGYDSWISADEIMEQLKSRNIYWANLQRFHMEYLVMRGSEFTEYKRRLTEAESPIFFRLSTITYLRLSPFDDIDNWINELMVMLNLDITKCPELDWPTKDLPLPIFKKTKVEETDET